MIVIFVINIGNLKKKTEISYIFKKALSLCTVYRRCGHEYKKVFKDEEESIEILKIIGLISNIGQYQKT